MLSTAQQMLQDSRSKIELIRLQIIKVTQAGSSGGGIGSDGGGNHDSNTHGGISPPAVSPVDARLAELQHYMQRETDVLVLAKDVVKQLEGISALDQKALAEAQSRVQESSQKLDLLRLSLEKCLKENNQELIQQPVGEVDPSEGPKSLHSSRPGCPLSTSPSIFSIRPASLTGKLEVRLLGCEDLLKTSDKHRAGKPSESHRKQFTRCSPDGRTLCGDQRGAQAGHQSGRSDTLGGRQQHVLGSDVLHPTGAVSRAGGWSLLAGPEGDLCSQVPATRGNDGQSKPQPGVQSGATGPPPRQDMIVNVSKKILLFWILQLQFIDTVIERQPKLRRQRCIFTKERGKNFLRAAQMNMNFSTWGHLMMSILPRYSSFSTFSSSLSTSPDLVANNTPRPTEKEPQTTTPLPNEAPVIRLSITEDQPSPTSLNQGDNSSTIITTAHRTSSVPALQENVVIEDMS
ncbi:Serine/threonine-protein kinase N2 [Larimichthys crocea]|uniref:Uncharacterized protein n=1 Tax=Larimichthys crocea TaxID=215358 RepID=A0ACD3Q9I8_LARCR|nr:Serine/threonine-protein kinase N2 [Larimichthys crocea]